MHFEKAIFYGNETPSLYNASVGPVFSACARCLGANLKEPRWPSNDIFQR